MNTIKQKLFYIVFPLVLFSLTACASNVKSWEKGTLADENMQLGGGDGPTTKVNEHTFTSKEATFGGGGIGGGGCGCN